MKRLAIAILFLAALAGIGLGARLILVRPTSHPPVAEDAPPFLVQPAGAGIAIDYQPSDIPMRSRIWSRTLPGGAVVVQLLSQANRQQVQVFLDGRLGPTLTLACPKEVPENIFNFAELMDAALVPDGALFLLYRTHGAGDLPLLMAWNLKTASLLWTFRGAGERLALAPGGTSLFLYGPSASVQCLTLMGSHGTWTTQPTVKQCELPPDASPLQVLLPLGADRFLAATDTELLAWDGSQFTRTPAPTPSPLGFTAPRAALARAGHTLWWQPEPGSLRQVDEHGQVMAALDLAPMIQGDHAQDSALLQLLGSDAQGALWFAPVAPSFKPPVPSPRQAIPVLPTVPPVIQPPAGTEPTGPAPMPSPSSTPQAQPLEQAWQPYLTAGLDRLYCWRPGGSTMLFFSWRNVWKGLGAPSHLAQPEGPASFNPAAAGFLLGDQDHRWWLPLSAVPLVQPR